jgi:hypothetical protein
MTSRRRFLTGGAATSALALFPWLEQRAKAAALPPRLLLYYTPHGTIWDQFRCSGGETDFKLSPILTSLEKHRDQVVIVDGMKMDNGTDYYIPHTYTMPVLWTGSPIDTASSTFCRDDHMQCFGWGTGTSVDQTIAQRLAPTTPYPTIELGYQCGNLHPAKRMIYSSPGNTKNPLDDPAAAFKTLFGGDIDLGEAAAARAELRRKSVLDTALADFASHRAKLSASDQSRLDTHAASIRSLEKSLVGSSAICTKPTAPTDITAETAIDRQSDLIAGIFGCGLTRIASFQLRIADNDNSLYPWVGLDEGGHHTLSHENDAATFATLTKLYTWYTERFAYLLDRLAATPDTDGTSVLDNTLVIWGSELGTGWTHSLDNVPFILAGGANTPLRGGRYLKVSNTLTNRVLVTALEATGITDVEKYGTTDTGSGGLPGVLA